MYKFIEVLQKLERIDTLIRLENTGSPNEFAKKLDISRSTLYQYLNVLKFFGADIKYCKCSESFIYLNTSSLSNFLFKKS